PAPARPPLALADEFDKTEAMVPMRDGVKLHTAVYAPKGASEKLPIILLRTPYGIDSRAPPPIHEYLRHLPAPASLFPFHTLRAPAADAFFFAFQDIRGRFKSEGTFVMTRPARDRTDPKAIDEASDTNDTIDWLLKTVPNHNGRVGMLGISYPGWLTAVAMLD